MWNEYFIWPARHEFFTSGDKWSQCLVCDVCRGEFLSEDIDRIGLCEQCAKDIAHRRFSLLSNA